MAKILRIDFVEARNLIAADKGGTSDPYCVARLMNKKSKSVKTNVLKKTLNPKWNVSYNLTLESDNDVLEVKCVDHDNFGKDDPLGRVEIPLETLEDDVACDSWYTLTGVKTGEVHLILTKTSAAARASPGAAKKAGKKVAAAKKGTAASPAAKKKAATKTTPAKKRAVPEEEEHEEEEEDGEDDYEYEDDEYLPSDGLFPTVTF